LHYGKHFGSNKAQKKILIKIIRMPVELHTVIGDVFISIE